MFKAVNNISESPIHERNWFSVMHVNRRVECLIEQWDRVSPSPFYGTFVAFHYKGNKVESSGVAKPDEC